MWEAGRLGCGACRDGRGGDRRVFLNDRRRAFGCLFVLSFCALFFSFEILHPVADILRAEACRAAAAGQSEPSNCSRGEEHPTGEAHGPYLVSMSPQALPASTETRGPVFQPACPEAPAYEPPPHIPIRLRA